MSRSICVKPAVDNLINAAGHQWQDYAPDRRNVAAAIGCVVEVVMC